jgi:transcriptional regulator with XRE-family HTH domain
MATGKRLGERLAARMKELKLNQVTLSEASGVSQNYISEIITGSRGNRRMGVQVAARLAKALDVPIDFFSEPVSLGRQNHPISR